MKRTRLDQATRKRQIKEATVALVIEKGFNNTSVQDIIDRVSLSKGGFYHYYHNKEALFKEILEDSLKLRKEIILDYRDKNSQLPYETLVVELLLNKILDRNIYKKVFAQLILDMTNNPKLFDLYNQVSLDLTEDLANFFIKEGFVEYLKLNSDAFGVLITSLMVGVTIFDYHDDPEFRVMLKDMIEAYFGKIELFGGENES